MIKFIPLLCFLLSLSIHASSWVKNRSGLSEYKKGNFTEAEKRFHEALIESPEKRELAFNRGCALYKKGDYEGASREFEKGKIITNPELKMKSIYNTANALLKKGMTANDNSGKSAIEEAAKLYKDILRKIPSDIQAKKNLEWALRIMEEMDKQQKQDQDKNKKNDQKNDKNKNQNEEQNKDQNKDEDKNNDQDQNKNDNSQQDKKEGNEEKSPQPKPGEMTKEEAQKLLDALKEDEKDKQIKLMQIRARGKKMEKDW